MKRIVFIFLASIVLFPVLLTAEPAKMGDIELAGITGQSGVEVSDVTIGGLTIDLQDDEERSEDCENSGECEEEEEGSSLSLNLDLPDSGFSADNRIFFEASVVNTGNQVAGLVEPLKIVNTVNTLISVPASTSLNIAGTIAGGFF